MDSNIREHGCNSSIRALQIAAAQAHAPHHQYQREHGTTTITLALITNPMGLSNII